MVSVLPSPRGPFDLIGEMTGNALNQTLPQAIQQGYNRGMMQKALGDVTQSAMQPGQSNLEVISKFLQATAGIPGSERYVGQVLPELLKQAEAARSANYPIPGEKGPVRGDIANQMQVPQLQQLPELFGRPARQKTEEYFPTNIGPQGGPGQAPQAATTGEKLPLRTRAEKAQAIKDHLTEMQKIDRSYKLKDAKDDIDQEEQEKITWNQNVDTELEQRKQAQIDYGKIALEQLDKVYPDASPELKAIFKKKGELVSGSGKSEADIDRYLSNEAKKIKNTVSNVREDLSASRSYNTLLRAAKGTYKNFNQSADDFRIKLQPLMDEGLYDLSRNLLEDLGYGPEEREMIIHPLSDQSVSLFNQLPDWKRITYEKKPGISQRPYTAKKQELPNPQTIQPILFDMKKVDPNFSLVLARKAFEDKGYDWRQFKNEFNQAVENGLELTGDQRDQLTYLDTPPLTLLDELLHNLNIIGR